MRQFFKVKNYEKFQHYVDRSPPWIKLYNSLLDDYEFTCLQDASKLHLVLIWLLASRTNNRLPLDPEYLRQAIKTKTKPDLDELMTSGFIEEIQGLQLQDDCASTTLATCLQDARLEESREEKSRVEKRRGKHQQLSDEEFLHTLKTNPAYSHIDFEVEFGKMDAWLSTRPGRSKTRKFIVSWLNNIMKPLRTGPTGDTKLNKNLAAIAEAQRRRDEKRDFQQGDSDTSNVLPQPRSQS